MTNVSTIEYGTGAASVARGQAEAWIRAEGNANDVVGWTDITTGEAWTTIGLSAHSALALAKDMEWNARNGRGAAADVTLTTASGRVLDAAAIKAATF